MLSGVEHYTYSYFTYEGVCFMKVHINLVLAFRQSVLGVKICVENATTPVYAIILKLFLEAITLAITLNLNAILTLIGA